MKHNELHRLVINNKFDIKKNLWIEPWGDNIVLYPNSTYYVFGSGPPNGAIEIDVADDSFTVYGWSRSVLTIFDEQKNVIWNCPTPVP